MLMLLLSAHSHSDRRPLIWSVRCLGDGPRVLEGVLFRCELGHCHTEVIYLAQAKFVH